MAYARLPDTFPFEMETIAAGNAAIGALCRYMAWSAGNRTDGFVPDSVAEMIGSKKERVALATHGLLERVVFGEVRVATGRISKKADVRVVMPGGGYWMPGFHVYNVSVLEDEAASEKGRKGGLASGEARTPEPQRGEPQVEPQVQPPVEPTGQDKTGQDKTGQQANPAVMETGELGTGSDPAPPSQCVSETPEPDRDSPCATADGFVVECIRCSDRFGSDERGAGAIHCPACAAIGAGFVTEGEARELRLTRGLLARHSESVGA